MSAAEDIGRRAMACHGFEWAEGMIDGDSQARLVAVSQDSDGALSYLWVFADHRLSYWQDSIDEDAWPEFGDPQADGALHSLVDKAWPDWNVMVSSRGIIRAGAIRSMGVREFSSNRDDSLAFADVLVTALEAAPKEGSHG